MKTYDHPKFRDVIMTVYKRYYIKEKDMWSLKVQFFHKRHGWSLCDPYRIKVTNDKFKEFVQR